jgi:hypothetical protein
MDFNESIVDIKSSFDGYQIKRFPYSAKALYGMDALKMYLLEHADEIKFSSVMPN